jgi:NAD(P)-dependent dehydrogenase (short-subunit alcohol dehydrogenase family)
MNPAGGGGETLLLRPLGISATGRRDVAGRMDGKRVLVTGAGQGMGREIAVEAARQGAEAVGVADRDVPRAEETVALLEKEGGRGVVLPVDLVEADQIERMVADFVGFAGGLDTLVNNAGITDVQVQSEAATLRRVSVETWDLVYAVNVRAMFIATKFAAPHLKASDRGPSVVNAASVAGMTGYRMPAYTSSKGAVLQLTRSMAIDLAPDVRCNAFCPGSIETPMALGVLDLAPDREAQLRTMTGTHLIPRFGTVGEIAKAVCFLASDDASFITGVALPVDGGTTAWRGLRD